MDLEARLPKRPQDVGVRVLGDHDQVGPESDETLDVDLGKPGDGGRDPAHRVGRARLVDERGHGHEALEGKDVREDFIRGEVQGRHALRRRPGQRGGWARRGPDQARDQQQESPHRPTARCPATG